MLIASCSFFSKLLMVGFNKIFTLPEGVIPYFFINLLVSLYALLKFLVWTRGLFAALPARLECSSNLFLTPIFCNS